MKLHAFLTVLVSLLIGTAIFGSASFRMLMYTYQSEGILVTIAFVDLPSGAVCRIDDGRISSTSLKVRNFPVSKQEFERIWSVTRELAPFEHKKDSSAEGNSLNYYVFGTSEMPNGEKRAFLVPKDRAPKLVNEVVREIRAYVRD